MAHLIRIDWPDTGMPEVPPDLSLAECRGRLASVRAAMAARGQAALVIYGDREHAANLQWLSGFDPRFEEAVLVVTGGDALLLAGNECLPYTGVSPLVAAGDVRVGLCSSLSLPSQPRPGRRLADWLRDAVPAGVAVGMVGWKWFGANEVDEPAAALSVPSFIVDPVRAIAGSVADATDLFMHPSHGLRARVGVEDIARLEFANQLAAKALTRMVFAFRAGMTDFEA